MTCRTTVRGRPRAAVMTQVLTIHAFVAERRDPRRRRALVMLAGAALAVLLAWAHRHEAAAPPDALADVAVAAATR